MRSGSVGEVSLEFEGDWLIAAGFVKKIEDLGFWTLDFVKEDSEKEG